MIYIDNSNLEQDAIDGKAYSANYFQGCKGIKSVTLNGVNVIVYEILFGKVEVIFKDGMEQQTKQL